MTDEPAADLLARVRALADKGNRPGDQCVLLASSVRTICRLAAEAEGLALSAKGADVRQCPQCSGYVFTIRVGGPCQCPCEDGITIGSTP